MKQVICCHVGSGFEYVIQGDTEKEIMKKLSIIGTPRHEKTEEMNSKIVSKMSRESNQSK